MVVNVEKVNYQGFGIGYINGKVIFIPKTFKGDIVDVNVTRDNGRYYFGEVKEYISKSKDCISSVCPFYDKCGGCSYMSVPYETESLLKENQVKEVFERNGFNVCFDNIITSDFLNYRNKVILKVAYGKIGFYEEGSHKLVNINYCYLCNDRIN